MVNPLRILLVEDNPTNREMLSRRLQRAGYKVLLALDGQQAIASTSTNLPDLVLMDLNMPVLDGWEAARQIKSQHATRHIPIIALTAQAEAEERRRAFEAGCDDYETKPIQFDRLLAKVTALLKSRTESVPGTAQPPASPAGLAPELKHNILTLLNQITGFADLLIEQAESSNNRRLLVDFRKIHCAAAGLLTETKDVFQNTNTAGGDLNHRLRTPLNDVIGFVELAQEQCFDQGQEGLLSDLQKIHTAASTLSETLQRHILK